MEERLSELGMKAGKDSAGETDLPEIHFYQSPDRHGQVFALSGLIEEKWKEKTPLDERTVVVLPSSDTPLSPFSSDPFPHPG